MKNIKVEQTKIQESKVNFKGDPNKLLTYADLLEIALDIVPQGGFTPKDIKERNRIQEAIDNSKEDGVITLEDSDFDAMEKIVRDSRWLLRDKELNDFLQRFESGYYKNTK